MMAPASRSSTPGSEQDSEHSCGGDSLATQGEKGRLGSQLKGFLSRMMVLGSQVRAANDAAPASKRSASVTPRVFERDASEAGLASPASTLSRHAHHHSHSLNHSLNHSHGQIPDDLSFKSMLHSDLSAPTRDIPVSQTTSLRSALQSIQRDLEDIALSQQQFLSTVSALEDPSKQNAVLQPTRPSPPISPPSTPALPSHPLHSQPNNQSHNGPTLGHHQRSKSVSSESGTKRKGWNKQSQQAGAGGGGDTASIKSARSMQSFDSKQSADEYHFQRQVEKDGLNDIYLKAGLSASAAGYYASPRATFSPEPGVAGLGETSSGRLTPTPPLQTSSGVMRRTVEEAEAALVRGAAQLGEGYPDTSTLMMGEGGRLLLPSEVKRMGATGSAT
ncbi:hypothetical protein BC830DRAFT_1150329 [Chytriomyces sp. MP71]|nr:hypothetical protein BC830DRAFT_1150329 [Chytriomyces sp. MP71]